MPSVIARTIAISMLLVGAMFASVAAAGGGAAAPSSNAAKPSDGAVPGNTTSGSPASAPATRPARRRIIVNPPPAPPPPNLIPGLSAQNAALKKIHEIYDREYADNSFNGRRTLALRLIDAADQTKKETDAKYVLLIEARDLAAGVGDITTAFQAIDRLVDTFALVKLHERIDVLKAAMPGLSTQPTELAAASICMDLAGQCVIEGDYERADIVLSLGSDASRRAKSVPYFQWIEARAAAIRPLKEAYDHAKPFEKILASQSDDPQANLEVGKFTAFVKGDFDAGLNMLFKGSDLELGKLADEDLETPNDRPLSQLRCANRWWDLAGATANSGDARYVAAMRKRAEFWYRKASPNLDGLEKALAQHRLQDLCPPPKTVPGSSSKPPATRPPDALLLVPKHWYRASIAEVTWDTAQRLCQESGGQLVSVNTRVEGDLMTKLARGRALWLGASIDPAAAGGWTWLSGNEMIYTNWLPGEPASLTAESHPITSPNGPWRTTNTGKAGFICEWTE
ncbi:MAG TPA: C-type lectin domain-containing protein [Tepidisphaeraceae bacterium]